MLGNLAFLGQASFGHSILFFVYFARLNLLIFAQDFDIYIHEEYISMRVISFLLMLFSGFDIPKLESVPSFIFLKSLCKIGIFLP